MKKDIQVLRDSTDARLGAVLTGEQMASFKAKREEWLTRLRAKLAPTTAPSAAGKPAAAHTPKPAVADTSKKTP
jgi:hypothetical protein